MKKFLIFCPYGIGGFPDYAHALAQTLNSMGVETLILTVPSFPTGRGERYRLLPLLPEPRGGKGLFAKIRMAMTILVQIKCLRQTILRLHFDQVFFIAYFEYLAPLWAPSLCRLAENGVRFGALVHDPVRDFVIGPLWWHRWSIAKGYSFLRYAFVHRTMTLETVQPMPKLKTVMIPHGLYRFPPANRSRREIRLSLGIPDSASVLLSFGHLRDGKNLDLTIQAMKHFPELHLLVVGKEQSSEQKPASFYQELAEATGVTPRCHWRIGHVPEEEVGDWFEACDIVLLTYSHVFRSSSGVLPLAVNYRKPVLASGGESALKEDVIAYQLGKVVASDSLSEIERGIQEVLVARFDPEWDRYERNHSWEESARRIMDTYQAVEIENGTIGS